LSKFKPSTPVEHITLWSTPLGFGNLGHVLYANLDLDDAFFGLIHILPLQSLGHYINWK